MALLERLPRVFLNLNGNMLSDGTNTFTWNARNQVATLNTASLQYDAFGRRIKNAAGKSFLFDGANAAQELSGATVTANLLSGGVDESFTRTDSSGSVTPLRDALGSTIALVDGSGVVATSYSYDPFGNTTVSGAVSANPSQYTGRENEGNGLYYYRSRYYSPLFGRFVSEDPAQDGSNFYSYADDDPVNLGDPLGLFAAPALPPVATPGLELVPGGAGGVVVTGLSWGGFLGLVGAGAALGAEGAVAEDEIEWFVALHNEQSAYDEEMHSIALYNQAMMTRAKQPGAQVLAGRYSARRKQAEHDAYKELCQSEVPAGANPCATLSRQIDHTKRCIAMIRAWDAKWPDPRWPLGRHANDINGLMNRLQNLKGEHNANCAQ